MCILFLEWKNTSVSHIRVVKITHILFCLNRLRNKTPQMKLKPRVFPFAPCILGYWVLNWRWLPKVQLNMQKQSSFSDVLDTFVPTWQVYMFSRCCSRLEIIFWCVAFIHFFLKQSAIESLFGASLTGIAYSLFAGQPLTILGSTGPVLVFEKILFKFCR